MAKRADSNFKTTFPIIQNAIKRINEIKGIEEWVSRDSIAEEIKKDEQIKILHSEYLQKDPPPKKQLNLDDWVINAVAHFSSHYKRNLKNEKKSKFMQKYIAELERRNDESDLPAYKVRTSRILKNTQTSTNFLIPEEIDKSEINQYNEGSVTQIIVNKYERSGEARIECINYHGLNCKVCEINFRETYGEIGGGFIHVHHLKEIHTIGKDYQINSLTDLIPVCPNCHSMLHKRKPPFTIEELKGIIMKRP